MTIIELIDFEAQSFYLRNYQRPSILVLSQHQFDNLKTLVKPPFAKQCDDGDKIYYGQMEIVISDMLEFCGKVFRDIPRPIQKQMEKKAMLERQYQVLSILAEHKEGLRPSELFDIAKDQRNNSLKDVKMTSGCLHHLKGSGMVNADNDGTSPYLYKITRLGIDGLIAEGWSPPAGLVEERKNESLASQNPELIKAVAPPLGHENMITIDNAKDFVVLTRTGSEKISIEADSEIGHLLSSIGEIEAFLLKEQKRRNEEASRARGVPKLANKDIKLQIILKFAEQYNSEISKEMTELAEYLQGITDELA